MDFLLDDIKVLINQKRNRNNEEYINSKIDSFIK